jgi:uncharacterized damage-inducible protein DinB
MIHTISEFEKYWKHESEATRKLLEQLTDKSLSQAVAPQDRTLGRIAWHLATTISEMMGRTGLCIAGSKQDDPVPPTAAAIVLGYNLASQSLTDQVKTQWTDATLEIEDDMYGEHWKRGATLAALILHQAHHRGQMTVLMRQAGLKVPGVAYGPAREEWANFGMAAPEV